MADQPRPKIATAVVVLKQGHVLLGKRKGDGRTDGMYGIPGGHLEFGEPLIESVTRETWEEVEIKIKNARFVGVVNVRDFPGVHYVILVFAADWESGEPRNSEPDRCEGWEWFPLHDLPENMTPGTWKGIEAFKTGQNHFE